MYNDENEHANPQTKQPKIGIQKMELVHRKKNCLKCS